MLRAEHSRRPPPSSLGRAGQRWGLAVLIAVPMAGCSLEPLPVSLTADPRADAIAVASRYVEGGYPDVIEATVAEPPAVYVWDYPQGVALWALLLLHERLDDAVYLAAVRKAFEVHQGAGSMTAVGGDEPIDYSGAMAHALLEYSWRSGDEQFLDEALAIARYFRDDVARTDEGLIAYHDAPELGRIWVDALFMVTPLLAKAGRQLDDPTYYADVVAQLDGFTAKLRDPDVGLYHQGWNWHAPGASPGYWGRANGWVALALTEVLDAIPADYAGRDGVLALYESFAAALVAQQGPTGMWHQLLDDHDSREETSCTAMFIYALSVGAQRGWLDDTAAQGRYRNAIDAGYAGLSRMIAPDGTIEGTCAGTGVQATEDDYRERPFPTNDTHGIGPVMLGAYGMLTRPGD